MPRCRHSRVRSVPRGAPVGGGGFHVVRLKYDALIFSCSLCARWVARTAKMWKVQPGGSQFHADLW
ncbi:unnamed protein product [Ixodes pacificus]